MRTNEDQRNKVVPVRMTKAEVEAVEKKAKKEGISRSEWIRFRALSSDNFISNKRKQEFFTTKMMVADEFQKVKKENEKKGCPINLDRLERSFVNYGYDQIS